ncbi:MAG: TetR/AcrR family transcriptional regulator [Flavobacteriales bacterium]
MEEQKIKYLNQILALFMKYGIKSVTMDDIAKELGVSKKTLYKYFKDKNAIVSTLMKMDLNSEMQKLSSLTNSSTNAIEETFAFSQVLIEKLKTVNPSLMYDLEKYHPKAWSLFINHKRVDVFNCIRANIERGIDEGFYVSIINAEVVAKLYSEKIDLIFNQEIFPLGKFSVEEVYTEMIEYHLRGIVNEKGRQYLIEKKKKLTI